MRLRRALARESAPENPEESAGRRRVRRSVRMGMPSETKPESQKRHPRESGDDKSLLP